MEDLTCAQANNISNVFSVISCTSWIFAQFPQILFNYRNKSARGISPHFLALWFLGDLLSFTSCLLNDSVLPFQIMLSAYFLVNDVILCFQYYYYNHVFKKPFGHYTHVQEYSHTSSVKSPRIPIPNVDSLNSESHLSNSNSSSYDSVNPITKAAAFAAVLKGADAFSISVFSTEPKPFNPLGQILAWLCTLVYVSSRIPQLIKNHKRKSVQGLSPLLFFSAGLGNLNYTISILTNCEFIVNQTKWDYFWQQLPYIIGSSGTLIFDFAYFYQKWLYKRNSIESFDMDTWSDIDNERDR